MRAWLRVVRAGLADGWSQPHDLTTSTNIEWLTGHSDDSPEWAQLQETLDRAINVGQIARAGRNSQAWKEGYWPLRKTT